MYRIVGIPYVIPTYEHNFLGLLPIQNFDAASLKFFFDLFEFYFMPSQIRKTAFVTCQITPKRFDNLKLSDGGQVMKFGYVHNEKYLLW
jgi:hypothetical protein